MTEVAVPAALVAIENVQIFLYQMSKCPSHAHEVVKKAKNCLEMMQAHLSDSKDQIDEDSNKLKDCSDIAHAIEDALDEYMFRVAPPYRNNKLPQKIQQVTHNLSLKKAGIKLSSSIEKQMILVKKLELFEDNIFQGDHDPEASIRKGSSECRPNDTLTLDIPKEDDEMLGFKESKAKLFNQLMEEDSELLTISVVGPKGSGKTTLVKNLYNDAKVQDVFDFRHWIDVPPLRRPLKLGDLFLSMQNDIEATKVDLHQEQDPGSKLCFLQQKRRFLLVLYDVRSKQELDLIACALSTGLPGSKIVLTTCNSDVASSYVKSSDYIHDLSVGLSSEEAQELFWRKANRNGIRPPDRGGWSKKIIEKLERSPGVISNFGSLLSTKPTTGKEKEWKEIYLSLESDSTGEYNVSIISPNWRPIYRQLPSHLKRCFLYLGIFPEDHSIQCQKLFRMWIAEGFVETIAGLTREKVAEEYLTELIDRYLVRVKSRGIDGRVKSCRVSNLVRSFIISQKFVTHSETISCKDTELGKVRCLSGGKLNDEVLKSGLDWSRVRTLQVHETGSFHPQFSILLQSTRFLKVLDLQDVPNSSFPESVVGLILLKYLSLRHSDIETVPKSIKKLLFLETLDLKHTLVSHLPEEVCKLRRLRHLLVYRKNHGNGGVNLSAEHVENLSSLQRLSSIMVKNNKRLLKALGELTELRKLGLTDLEKEDGEELCCALQKMENLSSLDVASASQDMLLDLDHMQSPIVAPLYLDRLYLEGRLDRLPKWIRELTSVTKIGLKWSKLSMDALVNPLQGLQDLPNLMELALVDFCTGKELVFEAQKFKKLKTLLIEKFDELNSMKIKKEAMPTLQKLSMSSCRHLKTLPSGIAGLILLKEFILTDMPDKFIANLQKNGEGRRAVKHVGLIHCFKVANSTKCKDLSPSQWHLERNIYFDSRCPTTLQAGSYGVKMTEDHDDETVTKYRSQEKKQDREQQ